jgi:hypothetical protein
MPIWGDEIREREDRRIRLKIESLAGTEGQRLAEERRLNRHITLPPMPPARGVYRDDIAPSGERWYKLVTSQGKVGTVHLPAELCDPGLEENLWKRLDAKDPARRLKAI